MRQNRNKIIILFFTSVVIMLGFGMVIPILPFYIKSFGASGSSLGLLIALYAIMQFAFAPFWGSISDRYGRKPILMLGVIGNATSQILFGMSNALWMLFVARIFSGILSSATLPTSMAYISDITSKDERSSGMGIMGAAMGVGMVLGPGISGWLALRSLSLPFFLAGALSIIALVLIYIFIPESLPKNSREKSNRIDIGPNINEMWRALFSPIGFLLLIAFLVSFSLTNFEGIFGLYALEHYNYGPQEVGSLLTFIGIISAIIQGVMIGPLTRRYNEESLVIVAMIGAAIGFILMLFAENLFTILLTTGFFIINNALLRPIVSSLTSKKATIGLGVAMGLNNAFMSLGRSIGPLWAGFVYDFNYRLPYFSGAIIMILGAIIGLYHYQNKYLTDQIPKSNS